MAQGSSNGRAPQHRATPATLEMMAAQLEAAGYEVKVRNPPPPPTARLAHVWLRTLPDVTRFVTVREDAEAAEAAFRRHLEEGVDGLIEMDSHPDGSGRRMRAIFRCSDMAGFAVDRLTAFSDVGVPQLQASGESSPVPQPHSVVVPTPGGGEVRVIAGGGTEMDVEG